MEVKFTVMRSTGQGEQTNADVTLNLDRKALNKLHLVYELLDERCRNRNLYLLNSMNAMKKLPIEAQMCLKECVNVLYGQGEYSEVLEYIMTQQDAYKARIEAEQAADIALLEKLDKAKKEESN